MIEILFSDSDYLFINKPAGLPVHQTIDKKRDTVESILKKQIPEKLFLAHRLDKDTSGVLLFTKSSEKALEVTNDFKNKKIQKTYWALTKTSSKIKNKFKVDNFLSANKKGKLTKMQSVKSGGLIAHTEFQILKQNKEFTVLECRPLTGRTHQIRVHLSELGFPILGDNLYGGNSSTVPRLMLHAQKLKIGELEVEAPLPKDFKKLLAFSNI